MLWHFIDRHGRDVTGTEEVAGYTFQAFFECDIDTANLDDLMQGYKGPDCDGIGVAWSEV